MLLLDIRSVFGDYYVFQQDGAMYNVLFGAVCTVEKNRLQSSAKADVDCVLFSSVGTRHCK